MYNAGISSYPHLFHVDNHTFQQIIGKLNQAQNFKLGKIIKYVQTFFKICYIFCQFIYIKAFSKGIKKLLFQKNISSSNSR